MRAAPDRFLEGTALADTIHVARLFLDAMPKCAECGHVATLWWDVEANTWDKASLDSLGCDRCYTPCDEVRELERLAV